MGQMTTQFNQAQSQNLDRLPSQIVQNPKNVSVITLRSGKQIDVPAPVLALELEEEVATTKRNMSLMKQ